MAYAIFTTSESSAYDDLPEERYHFPKTYLRQVEEAVGGLIVYYEPRRTTGPHSNTGRQAYFAMARLKGIEPDNDRRGHFYAALDNYIEFDRSVPFKEPHGYFESGLEKLDGSTNKGAFGRAVRTLPADEFAAIIRAGFDRSPEDWESGHRVAESVPEYIERPLVEQVVTRKFRDIAFRRHVRSAYSNTCAVTGLKLINGGGRPEVQAAHIRPVEHDGPDTVRNGLALTGTIHWLFDRGLLSVDDSFNILIATQGVPDHLRQIIRPNLKLILPDATELRPHPTYLAWHRENRFKS